VRRHPSCPDLAETCWPGGVIFRQRRWPCYPGGPIGATTPTDALSFSGRRRRRDVGATVSMCCSIGQRGVGAQPRLQRSAVEAS